MHAARPSRLETPVQFVKGVGPQLARLLEKKGVRTVGDLFYFLPRAYEDRRMVTPVARLPLGERRICVGEVKEARRVGFRGGGAAFEAVIADATGFVTAKWFHARGNWLETALRPGVRILVAGEVREYRGRLEMIHPDFETLGEDDREDSLNFGRIVPIYSETAGLSQKRLRRVVDAALRAYLDDVRETLPARVVSANSLAGLPEAIRYTHQPPADADFQELSRMRSPWHRRLIFDEFFFLSAALALRRRGVKRRPGVALEIPVETIREVLAGLPYALTRDQKRALKEIWDDLRSPAPMHRLLQGDVGSGKTVVALVAAAATARAGFQTALMTPTEILAAQHDRTARELAGALRLRVALLTASITSTERARILRAARLGDLDLLVGTHALIQKSVAFARLGLAIVDEQHRFGVLQRSLLSGKGESPNVLVMTATPIPRTLAMTVYGDLDVSVIRGLPPGRRPVETRVIPEKRRGEVLDEIRKELDQGRQGYIVYPLVEESATLDLRAATTMARDLAAAFPDHRVALLHGRMKAAEKERMMRDFREGRISLLVTTTLVEVGMDVPEASLIVVEHAERFGLSQLHQLRGRVGRGSHPSRCLLVADLSAGDDARRRLSVMERTTDGFLIAEEDLAIRGPGEFLGTRQSGLPELRIANLARDVDVLVRAKRAAESLVAAGDFADAPGGRMVYNEVARRFGERLGLAAAG